MNSYIYYSFLILGTLMASYTSAKYATEKSWIGVFSAGIIFNIVWATCAKYTHRLLFDAFLYDLSVTIFYYSSLIILLGVSDVKWYNILGLSLSVLGLILFKVRI